MAKKIQVSLPDEWFQQALQSVAGDVEKAGNAVAASITGANANSQMKTDKNGRPVAMVAITEPKGLAMQARHGTLTRAAAMQGLEVVRYKERDL